MPDIHAERHKNDLGIPDVVEFNGALGARNIHHDPSANTAICFRFVPDLSLGAALVGYRVG